MNMFSLNRHSAKYLISIPINSVTFEIITIPIWQSAQYFKIKRLVNIVNSLD